MGTGGESFHPNPRAMTFTLENAKTEKRVSFTPAAMAVRSVRLANAKEQFGDIAGMLRCCNHTSLFMALPDFDYDEFVALGGIA